eukprot:COSAG01_NODE_8779_length_2661_cov_24.829430_3_plen_75_part_00
MWAEQSAERALELAGLDLEAAAGLRSCDAACWLGHQKLQMPTPTTSGCWVGLGLIPDSDLGAEYAHSSDPETCT